MNEGNMKGREKGREKVRKKGRKKGRKGQVEAKIQAYKYLIKNSKLHKKQNHKIQNYNHK